VFLVAKDGDVFEAFAFVGDRECAHAAAFRTARALL
jgi:hypothetical protein